MTFHFYKGGIKNKYPSKKMTLEDLASLIRSDVYKLPVGNIRESTNKDQQNILKEKLDYVTVSGLFTHRHKQKLTEHSGLIVLDIDEKEDLDATFIQLTTDPFIRLMFISPRGNGIKAVVAIDPDKHESSYLELCVYMKVTYGIELDVSGSDVSRACYLSWHPDLYYNPDSQVYKLKGLIPPKEYVKKNYDDGQSRVDAKTIDHVTAVVERIEAAGINICGSPGDGSDYRTRLLLRFSLCTLGEAGRELTHRVFRFYEKYDPQEIDDKYSENIKNTRFTHPAFFFRVCKDHGIDVSKPGKKSAPAPAQTTVQSGQPVDTKSVKDAPKKEGKKAKKKKDDPEDDDYEPFTVWYRENGSTWVKAAKNWEIVADDFQIFVKYMTEDEQENKSWILELRHKQREVEYVEVSHEDFCSAKKLSTTLAGKRLSFKISDSHLKELHSYLFRKTEFSTAVKIIRFGYHPPSGVFIFANKAVNGRVMEPDEFGIIQTKTRAGQLIHLSMPVTNKNKVHRFTLTNHMVQFNDFFRKYCDAHGYDNAFVPACFFLMSLFRDVALTHKNFSPILFLKGGAGTGKSSMARVLTAGFGKKQEGVNLKSKNTDAALIKIMSQASNCICWFDEYHNEFPHEGLLQAAYDNDGYHRSKDNIGIETDAVEIHSALALTSNYLPDNPIFFSRCVFIPITSQEKSDQQRAAFYELEEWQEAGLGCLTVELLQYRTIIEQQFAFYYDLLYKRLKKEFTTEKNMPERLYANMAQVMAVGLALSCEGKIVMTESDDIHDIADEFVRVGANNIRRQHRIMSEKTALSEFFEILQQLYDQFQIHQEIHFDFERIGNENRLRLWFPQLYNLYAQQYRKNFQKAPADKDTLQTELAAFEDLPDWESLKKQIRFRNDGEGKVTTPTVPRPGCCSVNYDRLREKFGVEFETRKSKRDG